MIIRVIKSLNFTKERIHLIKIKSKSKDKYLIKINDNDNNHNDNIIDFPLIYEEEVIYVSSNDRLPPEIFEI